MSEDWLGRWDQGRIGWHEAAGNEGLKSHWPELPDGSSVLVPLCGKAPDLLWLAQRGHVVVGVELSDVAVAAFFAEHELEFDREPSGLLDRYTAKNYPITVYCGDYFSFESAIFDALYDRGALVALPQDQRLKYVEHTRQLLRVDATRLVITLEYDQQVVNGPPFSVLAGELAGYWDDLVRVGEKSDIENCPPKFRKAGLTDILEVVWLSC